MSKALDTTTRTAAAIVGAGLLGFGYMGWAIAAALHVPFPTADAIAMLAVHSGGPGFILWLATGMFGLVAFAFAVR